MTAHLSAEEQLRCQLAGGHREAFAWALACCRHHRSDAEDVLQAAYLKVLEGNARFDGRASFKTWLFSVIRITAADVRRRRVLRDLLAGRWAAMDSTPDFALSVDCVAEDRQQRELCIRAISALPGRQREVLMLVFYHEMSVEEAAQVMNVSAGSARQHYARAKAQLRQLLSRIERQR